MRQLDLRIVHIAPDGAIYITVPARDLRINETEEDYIESIAAKAALTLPIGSTRGEDTISTALPTRRFRDCWREVAGIITVDMPLARIQRLKEIRVDRDIKLLNADGPATREMEQGGPNYKAWKVYKQSLRDLPTAIDLSGIATSEALDDFEPTWPTPPGE